MVSALCLLVLVGGLAGRVGVRLGLALIRRGYRGRGRELDAITGRALASVVGGAVGDLERVLEVEGLPADVRRQLLAAVDAADRAGDSLTSG
ncbi:MAG: hypothetical protein R3B09_32350 [Nannocystaceae bacterium]